MAAPFVSDLEAHLGYWLRIASNGVSHEFARRLATVDITVAEWVLLRKLHDVDAEAPSRLAGAMGMTKGAISKLADRLIAKGLVERMADPDDGRAQTLALTVAGRGKVPLLAAIADENDAAFFAVLRPDEREALAGLVKALVRRRGPTTAPTE